MPRYRAFAKMSNSDADDFSKLSQILLDILDLQQGAFKVFC